MTDISPRTVGRTPPLGAVPAGRDLHAGDQAGLQLPGASHDLLAYAIDPEPYSQVVVLGLEEDVPGTLRDRLRDDQVEQLGDDRLLALFRVAVETALVHDE
jgi:hypothetical protein